MEEMKTSEEIIKLLGNHGANQILGDEWIPAMDDYSDYHFEGVQSVPDLSATPFLNQPNYVTIGTAPGWMSENFHNSGTGGNFKVTGESGNVHIEGEIPEYSPAPSSTSSFFAFSEAEEKAETSPRDETYAEIISSLGITEERLQKFSVKELNRFLKSHGLTKEQQQCVKNRRRTLKNRGYAQSCRVRRIKLKKSLETENEDLLKELDQLRAELQKVRNEKNYYKSKLVQLAKAIKEQKLTCKGS